MRVVFRCRWPNADVWLAAMRQDAPELEWVVEPHIGDPATIDAAVVWRPPAGWFERMTGLRAICAMGAGVDDLLRPGVAPPDVPVIRLVDPLMAERMAGWVLAAVLHHHRDFGRYRTQQRERVWRRWMHPDAGDVRVGILGLGPMGEASARLLAKVGYDVAGWSRRPQAIAGVRCCHGPDELPSLLGRSDFLVCLLPLTPATRGILGRTTFEALPAGAVVINAARGGHLVEADLLAALDHGTLGGAVLDVFAVEPLPADHPFWGHPRILITPHVASLSDPVTGAAQIVAALREVQAGRTPVTVVDRDDYRGDPAL